MSDIQVFFIHFAGGNRYSFQFLSPYLKGHDIHHLELPGRGKRVKEPLLNNFSDAVDDIFKQISGIAKKPYLIFGHSLGAGLALKVCEKLEATGKAPIYLVVSGNAGPGVGKPKRRYDLDDQDFKTELRNLGGVPEEVLKDDELFNFFNPILRADFRIAEENKKNFDTPVNTPIYALMGSEEEYVESISNWSNFTTSIFNYKVLNGNHFFIYDYPKKIASVIHNCVEIGLMKYPKNQFLGI